MSKGKKPRTKKGVRVRGIPTKRPAGRSTRPMKTGLDSGGLAYARLLADPCNAPLVSPVYSGSGTGQIRRFRTYGSFLSGANVDLQLAWNPAANTHYWGQTTSGASGLVGPLTRTFDLGNSFGAGATSRCLAACIRVIYQGAENARAGVVALSCGPAMFQANQTGVNSLPYIAACPFVRRLGEVQHEVKWVPSNNDEDFQTNSPTGGADTTSNMYAGNTLHVLTNNTPTGNVMIEFTAIYELAVNIAGVSGLVNTMVPPPSSNTLNDVLRFLGPPSEWAYGHVVAPVMKAVAGGIRATAYSAVNAAQKGLAGLAMSVIA